MQKQSLTLVLLVLGCFGGFGTGCQETTAAAPLRLAGFKNPESVLYDRTRDVYWVSNMGEGAPIARDGDGYISRLTPDGALDARYISSDRPDTTLNAPKGMAVLGQELFVADIDCVRVFDADTGRPLREISFPDAEFLNDLALSPDGTLYVSETGMDASLQPTGKDAIYRVRNGSAPERWLTGRELGNPNGLTATVEALWVATFGTAELLQIGYDGTTLARHSAPQGGLDGIEPTADGGFLVTSWEAKAVYHVTPTGEFRIERGALESPADLGFDSTRERLLVPLMSLNQVLIEPIQPK
ncbi:MAG TPA: SMP-30/gluconolactonase/LRE family protein [Polyangiaceae bacterium]|nr:SMP-30/gluconolactonase/LRE family protein [Polyangiaceae bacterium]